MILASPYTLASAIGSSISSVDGSGDEGLLNALWLLKTRTEAALNVDSLDLGDYEDTFEGLNSRVSTGYHELRLANAFLTDLDVLVSASGDSDLTPTIYSVDRHLGIVRVLREGCPADVVVSYTSGFDIPADASTADGVHPDPKFRVGFGLPPFIEEATAQAYVFWRRNTLASPGVTKEYGFLPTLNEAVIRNLRGSIYSHYMRPRFGMKFHQTHRKV